jgi:hypothetical protein
VKGEQGRRGPLSGLRNLTQRFTFDALKRRQKQDEDRNAANALRILKAQAARQMARSRMPLRSIPDKRGITKRPMAHVKVERRASNKRAKLARRVNRSA